MWRVRVNARAAARLTEQPPRRQPRSLRTAQCRARDRIVYRHRLKKERGHLGGTAL